LTGRTWRSSARLRLHPGPSGRYLNELLGRDPLGVSEREELPHAGEACLAKVMTSSRRSEVRPVLEELLERRYNVLTYAEELATRGTSSRRTVPRSTGTRAGVDEACWAPAPTPRS
jgi:hypothetical protein